MNPLALSALVLALPLALLLTRAGAPDPEPSPDLGPAEVVRIQVEALGANDTPAPDAGIAAAFRFASPGNRAATGPLPRFAAMVKAGYPDLLTFEVAEYGALRVVGDEAAQRVTLVQADGSRTAYVFGLSRQTGGACDGCWMTDAVVPAEPGATQTFRI